MKMGGILKVALSRKNHEVIRKIITFQQTYRMWTKKLSNKTSLERARMNLLFYHCNMYSLTNRDITKKLFKLFNNKYVRGKFEMLIIRLRFKGNL